MWSSTGHGRGPQTVTDHPLLKGIHFPAHLTGLLQCRQALHDHRQHVRLLYRPQIAPGAKIGGGHTLPPYQQGNQPPASHGSALIRRAISCWISRVIFTITFLRTFAAWGITATDGNDCPGADRKSFCLLLGKKFCGMCISPLDWRRRLWLSLPPATGA